MKQICMLSVLIIVTLLLSAALARAAFVPARFRTREVCTPRTARRSTG